MALDRRFGFAGAAAVLSLLPVQVLALDRRFGIAGVAAALMLVQVQVLALDRRFWLCGRCCRADGAGAGAGPEGHHVMQGMTSRRAL